MPRTTKEQTVLDKFANRYRLSQADVMQRIERATCGCAYGGTSWTTREEADRVAGLLVLAPGRRLLDVGAGSGWPALYLAEATGCDVVLADLPEPGLRIARDRADRDGLAARCRVALADAAALPFRGGAFDAVYHSDVLCCLAEKRAVLENCRRVIADDGVMVFSVVRVTPGLAPADHQRAVDSGPSFMDTDVDYPDLLTRTGWTVARRDDLTADYRRTLLTLRDQEARHADDLRTLQGEPAYSEEQAYRQRNIDALADGLLQRELYVARPV